MTPGSYGPYCATDAAVTLGGTPTGGTWSGTGVSLVSGVYKFDPATAGAGTFTLTYSVAATSTTCANSATTSVTVNNCITAHMYPTATTCCNYLSGTTAQLLKACLTLTTKGNKTTVANAVPGVFFYYGSYTPTASGQTTIVVQQTIVSGSINKLFSIQNTSNVHLSVGNCQSVPGTVTYAVSPGDNATATITFTAVAGQTYIVSVKYDMKSIIGATVPATANGATVATYNFSMTANGSLVTASTGQLPLVNGCSDNTPAASGSCPAARSVATTTSSQNQLAGEMTTSVFPNPTYSDATITFSVPKAGRVEVVLYNSVGAKVATLYDGQVVAGEVKSVALKGANLATGVYIYRVNIDGMSKTNRFIIMK